MEFFRLPVSKDIILTNKIDTDTRKLKILDKIQKTMATDIEAMNDLLRSALHTDHAIVNSIVDNYLATKGKQIRPILVMLSAKMFGGVDKKVLYCAAALEMLHNATLIHDDVVDQTPLRRGKSTVNAVWDNHIAVLIGDLFVSRALETGVKAENLDVVKTIADLGAELSLGEMDQMFNARGHVLRKEAYFDMIDRKTASLFMGCVRMGAQAKGVAESEFRPLENYARLLGEAFQIRDDIFDYYASDDIGKPSGHDLLEGKVTLPLLHALETAPEEAAAPMRHLLSSDNELDTQQIARLQEFAKAYGGIEFAKNEMIRLREDGKKYIEAYPESESRRDFEEIFDYIIERTF